MTDDCPFCAIAADEAPASVVYDGPETIAFMDLNPINEGHVLVIPREHSTGLAGLVPATGGRMFAVAQKVAAALRRSNVPTDGVNLFLADGEPAGQEVFHVHLHVIPRTEDDDVTIDADQSPADREDLAAVAEEISALL
ncbi:HIT family protein [Halorientalis salina]|uniref:HIT family protein n=1 Tax=Halorientalis salina TaxID=2932266 RepID=UPI0010AD11CF|nr:HIT family protein [Halorientalis salina]